MKEPAMTQEGNIFVEIDSDSIFFGQEVPIEVRDSQLRLVERSTSKRQFSLPAGLYDVSAVLEDGRLYKQLVQVLEGQTASVRLEFSKSIQAPVSAFEVSLPASYVYQRPSYTQHMDSITEVGYESVAGPTAELIEVSGASLLRQSRFLWVFSAENKLDAVPSALIRYGDRKFRVSLPISPEHGSTENLCVVKIEDTRSGVHADAWIAKERTVANALQNMLASGYMLNAAEVASNAVELLQYKYSDPTGAALGALILYKVGRLENWKSWLENLAHDFDWLPDGKVLLARLLYNNEATREDALDLAVKASSQRMLYSECYSLLLDSLRRWPRVLDRADPQQATGNLAAYATDIDWESICLSEVLQKE
jgi:hypothetical protein